MTGPGEAFRDFERAGWERPDTARRYHDCFSLATRLSIPALLDAAEIRDGMRVLDVACGAGYATAAAQARGAEARGVDFSATQIALARRDHPAIAFAVGDAEALEFQADSFDAVVNNFGMPHLPHPERAVGEAFRVLRPGGRHAFAAWLPPTESNGLGIVYGAIARLGNVNVDLPPGPNFFLFGKPANCDAVLTRAGFVAPRCDTIEVMWRLPDADALFETLAHGSVRGAALIAAQTPAAHDAIRQAVRAGAERHRSGAGIAVPMGVIVASARKP